MITDTRLGTLDDLLKDTPDSLSPLLLKLRTLIIELDPDTVEVPRPGEKTVAYGIGPKKMSEAYVYLGPQKNHLNLGFFHGTNLDDPAKLLEGSGKSLRHIKIHSLEQTQQPEVRALLEAAINERRRHAGT